MLLNAKDADALVWKVASEVYTENEGSLFGFRRKVRAKSQAMGLDPATILFLIQIAMMIYKWAKENGYLSSLPMEKPMGAPTFVEDDDA